MTGKDKDSIEKVLAYLDSYKEVTQNFWDIVKKVIPEIDIFLHVLLRCGNCKHWKHHGISLPNKDYEPGFCDLLFCLTPRSCHACKDFDRIKGNN